MALIRKLDERPLHPTRLHGEVECGYAIVDIDGEPVVQIETYGSPDRVIPGKVSQSLQLTREGAAELVGVLRRAFPGM